MVADDWWKAIHNRILQGDPTAPAELAEQALPLVQSHLNRCPLDVKDSDLIDNAAIDALMAYIKNPASFKQDKRRLLGYLNMSAEGDLRNSLAKANRQRKRERRDESVELRVLPGNRDDADDEVDRENEVDVESTLNELFSDPRDRQMAELVIEGVRPTDAFAKILRIQHLEPDQKQKEVKRHKDRIKKILRRKGGQSNG